MNIDQTAIHFNQWKYGCLHYYVLNDTVDYMLETELPIHGVTHQIIEYCFCPLEKPENDFYFSNLRDRSFSFQQLRMSNINSHQLYLLSTPINLLEQYEIYLNNNDSLSATRYYQCTGSWLGPLCQYSFDIERYHIPFSNIVKGLFQNKIMKPFELTEISSNLSCYVHLYCDRGGSFPACPDWREICDNKVDCTNSGIDEHHCDQLEINECNENEYRCYNGQCIPEDFLFDNALNSDCLDMTDESNVNS